MDYSQYNFGNSAAMAMQFSAEDETIQGLKQFNPNLTAETYYDPQDPTSLKAKAELEKARNQGVPFTPPSNGRMLMDMLGGMLMGYGLMRMYGADSTEALSIGLTAAGINHDKDKQEIDRYGIIQGAIAKNGDIYSPEILWNFMKTGDGKAMEQVERDYFNSGQTDKRYAHEDAAREDTQTFQAGEQADRLKQQRDIADERLAMERDRLNKGLGGGMALTDENGYLTGHGGTQAYQLANSVYKMKSPYVKGLQTRMQKLASAEGMIPQIQEAISKGDYTTAQQLFNTYQSDLAQANKGGNASISDANREELNKVGSLLNQWENKARSIAGYTPNNESMQALFNSMNAIQSNDRNALNNEVEKEVNALGGGVYNPAVVRGAASILMNQEIGTEPTAATSANVPAGAKAVQAKNSELIAANGQPSNSPEGSEISNGTITLKVVNGKWEVQD